MYFVKTESRKSLKHNMGWFVKEDVKKGTIIAVYSNARIMTQDEYTNEQKNGNELIIRTGARYVDNLFIYGDKICEGDYINHSFDPNTIYHCGILFAKKDLKAGDELTADYSYFLADNEMSRFIDSETGNEVKSLPSKETLIKSAQELIDLLQN